LRRAGARPRSAEAADKVQRDDLAIRHPPRSQIKTEAGVVNKGVAALKTDTDAAFKRNDLRGALLLLGQTAAVAPQDSATWLRLARTVFQIRPADNRERTFFHERASTAAYLAYQRAGNAAEEADALSVLGNALAERKLWRPALDALRLSLELREVAEVRGRYETLRSDHGFRLMDYSVDSDAASPRACFQFSEELAKRTDFTPFVALAGTDTPALTSEDKQLCVEGLRHGERYAISLRAGLPSTVKETLPKSADFNIYVRDRKPFVRFTGRAYVLPRTGQRGIPLVSVNTRRWRSASSDRRPQPDQFGARQRLPAQPLDLRAVGARRREGVKSGPARSRPRPPSTPTGDRLSGRPGGGRDAVRVYVMTAAAKGPGASSTRTTPRWRPSGSSSPISG